MKEFWRKLMTKLTQWLDPKLAKYRPVKAPEQPQVYLPETAEDLIWVIRRTPRSALTQKEREIIAAAMSFSSMRVKDLMILRADITFVHENDFLGPLTLDKLYRSGFAHFPVLGANSSIVGVIHTSSLNSLEIRETERAGQHLDRRVYYLREDYTLEQAFAAFLRTNCFFFMVVNRSGAVTGMLTYKMLVEFLLGKLPEDDFNQDMNPMMVAKR